MRNVFHNSDSENVKPSLNIVYRARAPTSIYIYIYLYYIIRVRVYVILYGVICRRGYRIKFGSGAKTAAAAAAGVPQ